MRKVWITTRINEEERERLDELATQTGDCRSGVIRSLIKQAVLSPRVELSQKVGKLAISGGD